MNENQEFFQALNYVLIGFSVQTHSELKLMEGIFELDHYVDYILLNDSPTPVPKFYILMKLFFASKFLKSVHYEMSFVNFP